MTFDLLIVFSSLFMTVPLKMLKMIALTTLRIYLTDITNIDKTVIKLAKNKFLHAYFTETKKVD